MSTLQVTNISDGTLTVPTSVLTQGAAKVLASWNGDPFASLDSYNQSSLTDGGTGTATIGFTSAMAATNYACGASISATDADSTVNGRCIGAFVRATTFAGVNSNNNNGDTLNDASYNAIAVHGELA